MAQAREATLGEALDARQREVFGRDRLIEELCNWATSPTGPAVTYVVGIAGIGKTTLVREVAARVAHRATVIEFDCGAVEPTDRGVLSALALETGAPLETADDLNAAFAGDSRPILLVLDHYDGWRLLDTWVRQELLPALPARTRVLIASRDEPSPPWRYSPEWRDACRPLELGPLDEPAAVALLTAEGVSPEAAGRINLFAHGHPLALALAAASLRDHPTKSVEEAAADGVTNGLATMFLEAAPDRMTRAALEAASLTRRATESLLGAQLGEEQATRAFASLEKLPFVRASWDGLAMHESVKAAVASRLRSTNPRRHLHLRRAAWRQLQAEAHDAGERDLWRYSSDILYLLENPILREGFFPTSLPSVVMEPALRSDHDTIRAIARRYEGPEAMAVIETWLELQPDAFSVARGAQDAIVGFRLAAESNKLDPRLCERDPVLRAWLDDIAHSEYPHAPAFLLRRWLTTEAGDSPGQVQAACWLDCKREYLRLRPRLGHVYTCTREYGTYESALEVVGFSRLESGAMLLDGREYQSGVMRFGSGSVDGWLSRLLAVELGIDPSALLDERARHLVLEGQRIPVTPLEMGVLKYLIRHRGEPVSRADLVAAVWGYEYSGESNVEAVVVRGLRAKLGSHASMIETVRGIGYRLSDEL